MPSKLKNYWLAAPVSIGEIKEEALAEYAAAHKMLVFNKKAIRPEQYPCCCALHTGNPRDCWIKHNIQLKDSELYKHIVCTCPCHAYHDDGAA